MTGRTGRAGWCSPTPRATTSASSAALRNAEATMDRLGADAYLARIAAPRPQRADAAALRRLQLRHLRAVPFENLSIHLGEEILLEEQALFDKLVLRRRGGV